MRARLEAGEITVDDIKAATATPAGMGEGIEQHQIVRSNSVTLIGLKDVRYNGKTGRVVKPPSQQNGRVRIELDDPIEPTQTAINVCPANILSSASADVELDSRRIGHAIRQSVSNDPHSTDPQQLSADHVIMPHTSMLICCDSMNTKLVHSLRLRVLLATMPAGNCNCSCGGCAPRMNF